MSASSLGHAACPMCGGCGSITGTGYDDDGPFPVESQCFECGGTGERCESGCDRCGGTREAIGEVER